MKLPKNRRLALIENDSANQEIGEVEVKLSWVETFREMAREKEHWEDFETVIGDGLED
ncbi:MAG TPA: hypothetical protein VMB21_07400 [Candidatus Limnocylindria bacterium]|jgi:hypothetical protein|nr:hypothetical protein [Candidatus Limnocylindria bacterium]